MTARKRTTGAAAARSRRAEAPLPEPPKDSLWSSTGRFGYHPDGTFHEVGFLFGLQGIAESPFDGPARETNAHFTFAAEPVRISALGPWTTTLTRPGRLTLYLQEQPASLYEDPASFARGEPIAMFDRRSLRAHGPFDLDGSERLEELGMRLTVFITTLVWSRIFEYRGEIYDVRDVVTTPFRQRYVGFQVPNDDPFPFRATLQFLCSALLGEKDPEAL